MFFSVYSRKVNDSNGSVNIRTNKKKTKKLYGPFLWMGFYCLKATARFTTKFPEIPGTNSSSRDDIETPNMSELSSSAEISTDDKIRPPGSNEMHFANSEKIRRGHLCI